MLFGSEKLIKVVSKTLINIQRKSSHVQKEALLIIFALNKFHQYLHCRKFILVTDHRSLLFLFNYTNYLIILFLDNHLAH